MVELLVSTVLLAVVMGLIAQFLAQVSVVNRNLSDSEAALRSVRQIIDEMRSDPEWTPEIPESLKATLTEPELQVTTSQEKDSPATRVTVSIVWKNFEQQTVHPVSLSYWKWEAEE
ncbi:type II secretion system protein [Thalassoglobus sp. JC818]|uniref:type IV pilus modification PilV family protein n=1 Tax=Thalassoglobus sp. JC818 TaxID=3232136 RepID=UPI00345B084B